MDEITARGLWEDWGKEMAVTVGRLIIRYNCSKIGSNSIARKEGRKKSMLQSDSVPPVRKSSENLMFRGGAMEIMKEERKRERK